MDKIISMYNSLEISKFKERISKLGLDTLKKLKRNFDNRYFNTGEDTVDDLRYDLLVEMIKNKDKDYNIPIGCKPTLRDTDNTITLPYHLGGMEKIKKGEDSKLRHWLKENKTESYIISDKLNGVSCMIVYSNTGSISLYTRGDGVEGSDISYLAKHIKSIPKDVNINIAIRGEFVIKTEKFEETYAKDYKNILSVIVGTINAKTIKPPLKDIDFVAYEIVDCKDNSFLPETNINLLKSMRFNTVSHTIEHDHIMSMDFLSSYLLARKESSIYDIDGIIIQKNCVYNRDDITTAGNPNYSFAFKMLLEVAEVTVENVLWKASKWGVLKPRIKINPTLLTGITINHATGFNAAYIRDNKINVGSRIVVTRSGDIIPYIVKVLTQSVEPKMPEVPFVWNKTGKDIMIIEKDESQDVKLLTSFFTNLNIEQINEGVVTKLVKSGYNTIESILRATTSDFLKIPTFKDKMAERIYNNIHTTLQKGVKLSDLMCASSIFGMGLGKKKAEMLCLSIPDIMDKDISLQDVERVEGFSTKTASRIVENIKDFKKFCTSIKSFVSFQQNTINSNKFENQKFVFSGFRDKLLEEYIISNGGSVSNSISSKTTYLVLPDTVNVTSTVKLEKARSLNIPIITKKSLQTSSPI